MAQKAQKLLAQKNSAKLNQTHIIALIVNLLYLLFAIVSRKRSFYRYVLLNIPAFAIEFWLERIGRPTFKDGELKRAGEDLEAKGLTEWMWDVVYWSWGNVVLAALTGDWAWWLMIVPVAYSIWLAVTTYLGVKSGMGGLMGNSPASDGSAQANGAQSKRQAKLEARGGQKVRYR